MNKDVFESFYKALPAELKIYLKKKLADEENDTTDTNTEVSKEMKQYLANKKKNEINTLVDSIMK